MSDLPFPACNDDDDRSANDVWGVIQKAFLDHTAVHAIISCCKAAIHTCLCISDLGPNQTCLCSSDLASNQTLAQPFRAFASEVQGLTLLAVVGRGLFDLALQPHAAGVAQNLVAMGVVAPHGRLGGCAQAASLVSLLFFTQRLCCGP